MIIGIWWMFMRVQLELSIVEILDNNWLIVIKALFLKAFFYVARLTLINTRCVIFRFWL
jgi:hypothetical protein